MQNRVLGISPPVPKYACSGPGSVQGTCAMMGLMIGITVVKTQDSMKINVFPITNGINIKGFKAIGKPKKTGSIILNNAGKIAKRPRILKRATLERISNTHNGNGEMRANALIHSTVMACGILIPS